MWKLLTLFLFVFLNGHWLYCDVIIVELAASDLFATHLIGLLCVLERNPQCCVIVMNLSWSDKKTLTHNSWQITFSFSNLAIINVFINRQTSQQHVDTLSLLSKLSHRVLHACNGKIITIYLPDHTLVIWYDALNFVERGPCFICKSIEGNYPNVSIVWYNVSPITNAFFAHRPWLRTSKLHSIMIIDKHCFTPSKCVNTSWEQSAMCVISRHLCLLAWN